MLKYYCGFTFHSQRPCRRVFGKQWASEVACDFLGGTRQRAAGGPVFRLRKLVGEPKPLGQTLDFGRPEHISGFWKEKRTTLPPPRGHRATTPSETGFAREGVCGRERPAEDGSRKTWFLGCGGGKDGVRSFSTGEALEALRFATTVLSPIRKRDPKAFFALWMRIASREGHCAEVACLSEPNLRL